MLGPRLIKILSPLLEGDGPDGKGEWSMHCPYHGDETRSASINVDNEQWYCHGCGEGGEARVLIKDKDNWQVPERSGRGGSRRTGRTSQPPEEITEAKLDGWHQALLSNKEALDELRDSRGLNMKTIKMYQLGWDSGAARGTGAYTIPIRDMGGDVVNVRRYQPNVPEDRRKIWSVTGMGTPTLFPVDQLENDALVICEGEMDALLTIQNGIPAITRTGTADHWKPEWSQMFRGKRVFICHDMDTKGQHANDKVAAQLRARADSIVILSLPYDVTPKHGLDLTDFWMDGHDRSDFLELVRNGKVVQSIKERLTEEEPTIIPVSIMKSLDSKLVDHRLKMQVTVTGKRVPSYTVLESGTITCSRDAGKKCERCPMQGKEGAWPIQVPPESPMILSMINVPESGVKEAVRTSFGIPKCDRWDVVEREHRTVEEVYVRPSIEQDPGLMQDFTHRKVISVGSYDLSGNQTVDLIGTIRPHPKTQLNEFQAWEVHKPTNTLESFELTPEVRDRLEVFRTKEPLEMVERIAQEMAAHTTKIYQRDDMHMFMDLVFHSGLHFALADEMVNKGWLDAIIIGDTRTGKSEAAHRIIELYGMGSMVSCESATYAGVVGGLDRTADGQWVVKWGAIPINDRRMVVLDEVSGLKPEEISQMTNIRSEGKVTMTKIQTETAHARTRLLWLANPRDARMDDFTFGVQAMAPLVGNHEDLSRFDMAMGAFSHEVGSKVIHETRPDVTTREFSEQALRDCLRWAWTRTADKIKYTIPAVNKTKELADELGGLYTETPPLVQVANVRFKIARIAVAFAMRTFSADAHGNCVVRPYHVEAAVAFMDRVYSNPSFGYKMVSEQAGNDRRKTVDNMEEIMSFIVNDKTGLKRFLKHTPVFDRQSMETLMNVSREVSSSIISRLWDMNAIVYEDGRIKMNPEVMNNMRWMTDEE